MSFRMCWSAGKSAHRGGVRDWKWQRVLSVRANAIASCAGVGKNAGACAFKECVSLDCIAIAGASAVRVQMHTRFGAVEYRIARNCIVVGADIDAVKRRRTKDFVARNG